MLWTQALARGENPRAHLNLGIELADAGRPLEALAHYEAAARINPRNARARYNEGNVLLSLGRREDAVAAYADAIRLDPRLPEAYYNLANALVQLHRPAPAVTAYAAALRLRQWWPVGVNVWGLQLGYFARLQDDPRQREKYAAAARQVLDAGVHVLLEKPMCTPASIMASINRKT